MAIKTTFNKPHVSDNSRNVVSALVKGSSGDGDYVVLDVPRYAKVTVEAVEISTAFSGTSTGTLTVGYKHADGSIVASGIADDSVCLSEATGTKQINKTMYFPKGGIITLGVTKGDSSADIVARLHAKYSVVYA